jgi:hypothetical protein
MASEAEISTAEARLGLRLPPSYRRTLVSGHDLPGDHDLKLLGVGEIDRFATREPEWLDAWLEGYRSTPHPGDGEAAVLDDPNDPATLPADQLGDTIIISTTSDERLLLLNPAVTDASGEWEAWDFANWYPGAYRHPSFEHLLEALDRDG